MRVNPCDVLRRLRGNRALVDLDQFVELALGVSQAFRSGSPHLASGRSHSPS